MRAIFSPTAYFRQGASSKVDTGKYEPELRSPKLDNLPPLKNTSCPWSVARSSGSGQNLLAQRLYGLWCGMRRMVRLHVPLVPAGTGEAEVRSQESEWRACAFRLLLSALCSLAGPSCSIQSRRVSQKRDFARVASKRPKPWVRPTKTARKERLGPGGAKGSTPWGSENLDGT
jgi:hypothetical protein